MAEGNDATFYIDTGLRFNSGQIQAEVERLGEMIRKTPPLTFVTTFKDVDTGNAQEVFNTITKQATALEQVTVNQQTLRHESGKSLKLLTGMTVQWSDANGNVYKTTEQINSSVGKLADGWKRVSNEVVRMPLGKQTKEIEQAFARQGVQFDGMTKKAENWYNRSNSMNHREKKGLQESATALKAMIAEYDRLMKTGDTVGAQSLVPKINDLNKELDKNISLAKRAAGAVRSWSDNLVNAIKQTITYTFSIGGLRMAMRFLNDAMQFAIDLNTEMTKIQVLGADGAQTSAEIRDLTLQFNALGKELAATTNEVAEGSVEWLRQGKTVEETMLLMRSATYLGKLGNLSLADSTEYLTSTLNSFKMEAEDASLVVDKLIAVDNIAATSAGEMATALRYSAASADDAGISFDQLVSYIATVSSTTRMNAEMIGQAMKTLFARMRDIQAGAIDEDGLGINNVEKALSRVNIALRDTPDSFRPMGDVLEELALKWDTLNEIEQENISKNIAGLRQRNIFAVMMREMNTSLEYQEEMLTATGLAAERYDIYLNSVEASKAQLKASLESLFLTFNDFDSILIGLNQKLAGVIQFITKMGGLKTVVLAIGTAVATLNSHLILGFLTKLSAGITAVASFAHSAWLSFKLVAKGAWTAKQGIDALNISTKALSATSIVGILTLIAGTVITLSSSIGTLQERIEKTTNEIQETNNKLDELREKRGSVRNLIAEFEELSGKTTITTTEQERLVEVQNELKELLPGLIVTYDGFGNAIIKSKDDVIKLNDGLTNQISLLESLKVLQDNKKADLLGKSLVQGLAYQLAIETYGKTSIFASAEGDLKKLQQYQQDLIDARELFIRMSESQQERFLKTIQDSAFNPISGEPWTDAGYELIEFFKLLQTEMDNVSNVGRDFTEFTCQLYIAQKQVALGNDEFIHQMQIMQANMEKTDSVLQKIRDGKAITTEEMANLTSLGLQLVYVNGELKVTERSLEEYYSTIEDGYETNYLLDDSQRAIIKSYIETSKESHSAKNSLEALTKAAQDQEKAFISNNNALKSILEDYQNTGQISYDQARKMIEMGYAEAVMIDTKTGAITLNTIVLRNLVMAEHQAAVAGAHSAYMNAVRENASISVTNQLWKEYQALVALGRAMGEIANVPVITSGARSGGGAGGGGGKSSEELRLEREIKLHNEKKDALKEHLDEFKEYIELQKELLKRQKEEKEFADDLLKKNMSLAKLRAQIAILALDDSEEARAKRLKYEEEASELEVEIQEDKEERIYELQIQALDDVLKAFEDNINAQIKAIDLLIEKIQEQIKAMTGSGGGGGGGSITQAFKDVEQSAEESRKAVYEALTEMGVLTSNNEKWIGQYIDRWIELGYTVEEVVAKSLALIEKLPGGNWGFQRTPGTGGIGEPDPQIYHEGGIVTKKNSFASGNLEPNEVYAKLLEGEYVSNEKQMDKFLSSILPSLVNRGAQTISSSPSIAVSMPITVQGNMDNSVIPNIEIIADRAVRQINTTMKQRGYVRRANLSDI